MSARKTPAQATADGEPVGWMRRFAYDGIDVMAIKKRDRPHGWQLHDITRAKFCDDDVPVFAKPPAMKGGS